MTCPQCRADVEDGLLICPICGGNVGAGSSPTPIAVEPPHAVDAVVCTACGEADQPAQRPYCVRCLGPLGPAGTAPRARLVFVDGTELVLEPGTEIVLGRDPTMSPASRLLDLDTVSRVHATVGRDRSGSAWVREENATNVTLVNGRPVPKQSTVPLRDGDELGLSSAVVVRLRID